MSLPTITELAKGTAYFVKYQDGALWYEVTYGVNYQSRFLFPIPVDVPPLYEVIEDAVQALKYFDYAGEDVTKDVREALAGAHQNAMKSGAGAGEFLASDKAIRFLRWIRPQLALIQNASAVNP